MGSRSGRGEGRLHCKARCSKPKVCLSLSCLPESVRVKGQLVPCPSSAGIVFFISFPPTFYFEKCRARRGGGVGRRSAERAARAAPCACAGAGISQRSALSLPFLTHFRVSRILALRPLGAQRAWAPERRPRPAHGPTPAPGVLPDAVCLFPARSQSRTAHRGPLSCLGVCHRLYSGMFFPLFPFSSFVSCCGPSHRLARACPW